MVEAASAPDPRPTTVFVWYAAQDRPWAEGYLLAALADAGVVVTTEADFVLGRPLLAEFERAITSAQWVVLVVSRAFVRDDVAERIELMAQHYGLDSGTWPVIPLVLDDVQLPVRLRFLTSLDLAAADRWASGVDRLVRSLGRTPVAPRPAPPCPYPGLTAFEPQQSDQFFGREVEVEDAVARLVAHGRSLTVVGPSGSGKSSLALAGIVPELVSRGWQVSVVRPADVLPAPRPSNDGERRSLLVVDQAEEFFTLGASLARSSFEAVRTWADTPGHAVLLTLRADFYPQVMTSPLWPLVRDRRLELVPMAGAALRRAIVRPAEDVGVLVESALVERLAADAEGEPGYLPLLQETLVLLWGHLERRLLPLSAYEALVLPRRRYGDPPRTGLQVALARQADGSISALDDAARRIARRIFVRLVHFDDGRVLRRRQRVDDLRVAGEDDATFDGVLDQLVRSRLITKGGGDDRAATVDLAHEALITAWPTFQTWLSNRRAHEGMRRRLEEKASEWRRLGGGHGGLLDDIELGEAERWLAAQEADDIEVSADLEKLLAQSRAALDARRIEEQHRRAQELATNRRLRVSSVVLTVFLLSTLVLLVAVNDARRNAERARVAARAGEIAATAMSLPDELFDRALLLGVAGYTLHPDDTRTRGALLSAVTTSPRIVRQFHVDGPVRGLALNADGLLAIGTRWGDIELRQLDTGERTARSQLADGELRSLAFTADGRSLVAGANNGLVSTWDASTGRPVGPPARRHSGSVRALAFSPDGRWSASAGADHAIVLHDAHGGEERLTEHRDWVNALGFTPDGGTLVSAGGAASEESVDERVIAWDLRRGAVRWSADGHDDAVRALAISEDGRTLATAGADDVVVLWDLATGQQRARLEGHTARLFAVTFVAGDELLASAGRDHTIRLWDPASGQPVGAPLTGHSAGVSTLVSTPTGQLISGADDGRVIVWDVSRQPTHRIASDLGGPGVDAVARSGDGAVVAIAGEDGTVTMRNGADGRAIGVVPVGERLRAVGVDAGGRRLATITRSGLLRLWDTASEDAVVEPRELDGTPQSMAVAPDGRIAVGGRDGNVQLWTPDLRAPPATLSGHTTWVTGVGFLDATRLASVGADGRLLLHDVDELSESASSPTELDPEGSQLTTVATAPATDVIVTGDTDRRVRSWDATEDALNDPRARTLTGHDGTVTALTASPDGRMFASGDDAGTMILWDARGADLTRVGQPLQLDGPVNGLAFGDAGRTLLVGTAAGTQLWSIDPGVWVDTACAVVSADLSELVRRQFAPDIDRLDLCPGRDLWRRPEA